MSLNLEAAVPESELAQCADSRHLRRAGPIDGAVDPLRVPFLHAGAMPVRRTPTRDRDYWRTQLRSAIRAWFQPKWEVSSGRIVGAEALARWEHVDHGVLPAGAFLAAIRCHGLEQELLCRMLDDAVAAHAAWNRDGYGVPVAVNLPATLLDTPGLAETLHARVVTQGGSAENITFELLEDDHPASANSYVLGARSLRQQGFGLALDDFGRGFGSLYNLISAPFTEIKIDRAFVDGASDDDLKRAALVSSVQLGRQLALTVTAEGVETVRDLDVLRGLDCHCAQGYLCAPAMSAQDFAIFLGDKGQGTYRLLH